MGLMQIANADSDPSKFVAIVGSASDDNAKLLVPDCLNLIASKLASNIDMNYAPSPGIPRLAEAMLGEVLGLELVDRLVDSKIKTASIVTCAGTNAIANTLITCSNDEDFVITHNPHWAGYDSIMAALKRPSLEIFEILDSENKFNLEAFAALLDKLNHQNPKNKIIILMNTPFDNPLGKDFGQEAFMQIAKILNQYQDREILMILDTAYIDFGPKGKDYSRLSFLPDFFAIIDNPKFNLVIAATVSKSFAMYSARVGFAILLSKDEYNIANWKDIAGGSIRGTFSNANRFAQEIALTILENSEYLASVHKFQYDTAQLLKKRQSYVLNELKGLSPEDFRVIVPDGGFFVSIKINEIQFAKNFYAQLLARHIYMPLISEQFLRIPICGLNLEQLKTLSVNLLELQQEALSKR